MLYNAKNKRLYIDGTYMDYASFGSGQKTMLIIPGLNLRGVKGAALSLAYMYRLFAREYTVYIFDRKANLPEDCSIRTLSDDLATAMEKLGLRDACVFGVSQGGMIALQLAADHPGLVKKLVPALTLSRPNDTVKAVVGKWIEQAESGDLKGIVSDLFAQMYTEAYMRRYRLFIPLLHLSVASADLKRFSLLARSCISFDIYDRLGEIRCPCFVIGANEDKIVTGEASAELAEKLGAELYMYPHLGHAAYEEAKDFNQRIYDFFKEPDIV